MNDLAPILRRVAAINPVPDETDLPANVMSATALLDTIDERTGAVQTQQHHTKPQEGPKRRTAGIPGVKEHRPAGISHGRRFRSTLPTGFQRNRYQHRAYLY